MKKKVLNKHEKENARLPRFNIFPVQPLCHLLLPPAADHFKASTILTKVAVLLWLP